jgi:hypothetical protein
MYWWAVSVLALGIITTFIKPLRLFGQGHMYMKLSVFPTAYSLARGLGPWSNPSWFATGVLLASVLMSLFAIGYLYAYLGRQKSEHASEVPPDVQRVADHLRRLPPVDIMCLPLMYADYLTFSTGNAVYWGGHNTGFKMIEDFFPVLRRPIEEFILPDRPAVLVIDTNYVNPDVLKLDGRIRRNAEFGSIQVYEFLGFDAAGLRWPGQLEAVPFG